jgi:phage FluMu protein Com
MKTMKNKTLNLCIALVALFAMSCIPSSNNYNQSQSRYYAQPSHNSWQQRNSNNRQSQYYGQQGQYSNQQSQYNRQPSQYNSQPAQYNNQQPRYNNQQAQYNNHASQYNHQPQYNSSQRKAPSQPSVGVGGSTILAMLGQDNSAATGFMMSTVKGTSPVKLSAEDKELLEDTCASCHDMNRVYWNRGTREIWENILAKEYHEENGWEKEDLEPLYKIFRNFPVKEPWLAASDKEYLEKQCSVCHTLNRIFWNHGPREIWKSILNQKQHQEANIKSDIKKQVFSILRQYLFDDEDAS